MGTEAETTRELRHHNIFVYRGDFRGRSNNGRRASITGERKYLSGDKATVYVISEPSCLMKITNVFEATISEILVETRKNTIRTFFTLSEE